MQNPKHLLPPDPGRNDKEPSPGTTERHTLERVDGTTREIRDYLLEKDPDQTGEDELLTTVREALSLLLELATVQKIQSDTLAEMAQQIQHIRDSV